MLIPAAISLIISTIVLNLGLLANGVFSSPDYGAKPAAAGKILGAIETGGAEKIFIDQGNNFNKAVVRAIEEAKTLPLLELWQLPGLNQPLGKLPENKEKEPAVGLAEFDLPAANGVILDCQADDLFFAKRPDRAWPIASITKLITAYVFLDYNPGWETGYTVKAADRREGGKIYLFSGDKAKVKDLFYFSLVGSENTATAALVASTGLSEAEFVQKMNDKMKQLGFKNTRLVDPVGLKDGNISTAREIARFAKIALADPDISQASLTKKYEFTTEQGRKKVIANTNELLGSFPESGVSILGGKTGHVNSSGYCLVSQFKDQTGQSIVTVILGADNETSRFSLTKKLVDLYYGNKP